MTVHLPTSLSDALALLAAHPDATVLAGGTDLMVELNAGHRRATSVLAIDRIPELRTWRIEDDRVVIGAGCTYRQLMTGDVAAELPALAEASRTVGSPQIRQVGTIGGNLGTCSPAGDALPVLSALDARIHLASADGTRVLDIADYMVGVKRTARRPDELVTAVEIARRRGWQGYAKVGVRNAMVISVASACVVTDVGTRTVAVALGSVAPTVIRCAEAESWVSERIDWAAGVVAPEDAREFGAMVSAGSRPIDDHRSTAAYRRHAVGVLAQRLLHRAFARPEESVR